MLPGPATFRPRAGSQPESSLWDSHQAEAHGKSRLKRQTLRPQTPHLSTHQHEFAPCGKGGKHPANPLTLSSLGYCIARTRPQTACRPAALVVGSLGKMLWHPCQRSGQAVRTGAMGASQSADTGHPLNLNATSKCYENVG